MIRQQPDTLPSSDADRSSAERLQSLANTVFQAIEKNTGHKFPHDTVERAFLSFQDITASLGLAWLIDATKGTGMSHLGWCGWMNDARQVLGIKE